MLEKGAKAPFFCAPDVTRSAVAGAFPAHVVVAGQLDVEDLLLAQKG